MIGAARVVFPTFCALLTAQLLVRRVLRRGRHRRTMRRVWYTRGSVIARDEEIERNGAKGRASTRNETPETHVNV